jgi:hypothetical protein
MVNPRMSEKTREEVLVPLRAALRARRWGRLAWLGDGLFVAYAATGSPNLNERAVVENCRPSLSRLEQLVLIAVSRTRSLGSATKDHVVFNKKN